MSLNYEAIRSIPDVFAAVQSGSADYGVIPIENSTEGVVFHSMDTLVESELQICSQVYLPIEHCLISHSKMDAIESVCSKDQALGQCRDGYSRMCLMPFDWMLAVLLKRYEPRVKTMTLPQ